jgi:hypothetical protein
MNTSIARRISLFAGVVALTAASFASGATPAGAATANPCKVLKQSEIQSAFGGTVSTGRKGLSTAVSAQCEYQVGADGDRPAGTVVVHVMTTGAKAAYKGLKKVSDSYAPLEGVPNALWNEKLRVVNILKGSVLLGVQGGFTITDPLPIHFYDDETQLSDLAQIGVKRV